MALDLHRDGASFTLNAKKLQFQLSTSFIKCGIDPTSLSLSSLSCSPTLHVFIKLNKLHVCLTFRLANWDTGSFIRTQSARFSPAQLIGRTALFCRSRSFRLSQLCSSHWHPTKSFSLNQGIKPADEGNCSALLGGEDSEITQSQWQSSGRHIQRWLSRGNKRILIQQICGSYGAGIWESVVYLHASSKFRNFF